MKIQKECIPCLLKRIVFEADESTHDDQIKDKVIKQATKAFSEAYRHDGCSASIATQVHKAAYRALQDNDPYKSLKSESNRIALSLVPEVKEFIRRSDDPLKMSMLCAIIGNSLDFGIDGGSKDPSMLYDMVKQSIKEGFGYDDTNKMKDLLFKSKHALFFTDNCGEIVFDKLFCQELKKHYPQIHITLVVKGKPVLSDATLDDVKLLDFETVVDEVITTGCFAVGYDLNNVPSILNEQLNKTDLIISKGMANYEVFSETNYKPIAYLLRTKCVPIARSMQIPEHINAVKVYS